MIKRIKEFFTLLFTPYTDEEIRAILKEWDKFLYGDW